MTTNTRGDVHRPSAINPADYQFVGQECIRIEGIEDCYALKENRERIAAHMARTGGTYSNHAHGGNCMVCGSVNAIYTVLFYHEKTNTYVRMGQDCATKCEMGDESAFNAFRAGILDARERLAGKQKAQALLSDHGLSAAWAIYEAGQKPDREESIIADIVSKLVKYGSLSEKQFSFLGKLVDDIAHRAEREAQRAAEHAAAKPCPTGRIKVSGTVITTKIQTSDFGNVLKMLVQSPDGWKVWGTVPRDLDVYKGDRVEFTAMVEPSKDDDKFGFFKRPTKAAKVS